MKSEGLSVLTRRPTGAVFLSHERKDEHKRNKGEASAGELGPREAERSCGGGHKDRPYCLPGA
jgi:hypothetical protein